MKRLLGAVLIFSAMVHAAGEGDVDVARKMKECEQLVAKASMLFAKKNLAAACRAFRFDDAWRVGDITVFVIGEDGVLYVQGDEYQETWEDYREDKDLQDHSFVAEMFSKGDVGGWVSYPWQYALKYAFVKVVEKKEGRYIVGAGFFPESAEFRTEQMVKLAVKHFYESGKQDLFENIDNSAGRYVLGDIFLWAYQVSDNKVTCVAHGDNMAMVGQDVTDWKDDQGRDIGDFFIKIARSTEGKSWIDYTERGVDRRAYVERVVDKKNKQTYLIGGAYYPNITDDTVKEFLRNAVDYLRANGAERSFREFSNSVGEFVKGPLTIFVYDLNGKILADSQNPKFVGQTLTGTRDAEGNSITGMILDKAKTAGKGWITFVNKNAYYDVYVMYVKVPDGDFIIGTGYWPSSKPRSTRALVEKAIGYFHMHSLPETLRAFAKDSNEFIRGDLHITVYDEKGTVLVDGTNKSRIWKDERESKNKRGGSFVEDFIDVASSGGGWVEYTALRVPYRAYVRRVDVEYLKKGSENQSLRAGYIISCSYNP